MLRPRLPTRTPFTLRGDGPAGRGSAPVKLRAGRGPEAPAHAVTLCVLSRKAKPATAPR